MKKLQQLLIGGSVLLIAACVSVPNLKNDAATQAKFLNQQCQQVSKLELAKLNAKLAGSYLGTLPCADCAGIKTTLQLNVNQSYHYQSIYLKGPDSRLADVNNGKFVFDCTNPAILNLDNGMRVFVDRDLLAFIDKDAKPIGANYILKRVIEADSD